MRLYCKATKMAALGVALVVAKLATAQTLTVIIPEEVAPQQGLSEKMATFGSDLNLETSVARVPFSDAHTTTAIAQRAMQNGSPVLFLGWPQDHLLKGPVAKMPNVEWVAPDQKDHGVLSIGAGWNPGKSGREVVLSVPQGVNPQVSLMAGRLAVPTGLAATSDAKDLYQNLSDQLYTTAAGATLRDTLTFMPTLPDDVPLAPRVQTPDQYQLFVRPAAINDNDDGDDGCGCSENGQLKTCDPDGLAYLAIEPQVDASHNMRMLSDDGCGCDSYSLKRYRVNDPGLFPESETVLAGFEDHVRQLEQAVANGNDVFVYTCDPD